MHVNRDLYTLSFLASCLLSNYLVRLAWKPPNPPPKAPISQHDLHVIKTKGRLIGYTRSIDTFWFGLYCLVVVTYPNPPTLLCPFARNLTSHLLAWSLYTTTCVSAIITSALLRLYTFKQLGKDFSFILTRPSRLVTTGVYAHVQHPSYTTAMIFGVASTMLTSRIDGTMACWLPRVVVEQAWWANWILMSLCGGAAYFATMRRVRVEEMILKETFGEEWEDWAAKTPRFLPWIS